MSLKRVLVANRGEIAVRVIRACHAVGAEAILAASEADLESRAARWADHVLCIGPGPSPKSYLSVDRIVGAALAVRADALHPGYGFLAENPTLAARCEEHGVAFVGPSPKSIEEMGNKLRARQVASDHGLPIVPGSDHVQDLAELRRIAESIGLPLLLKAAAGGGGRGMRVVRDSDELETAFLQAAAEARAAFGDPTLYVERYFEQARHVEVQLLGDGQGGCLSLGERDCSVQRRHQKLIEESPSPAVNPETRARMAKAATELGRALEYRSAGTVEFLFDESSQQFYFLEMNTRIQVEHPVTEMVSGLDLVAEQLRIAGGMPLPDWSGELRGHSIEARLNAEDPRRNFLPNAGRIVRWKPAVIDGVRYDTHCYSGYEVPVYYDSLLCKVISHAPDRPSAIDLLREALAKLVCTGIATNREFLLYVLGHPCFRAGLAHTTWLERAGYPEWKEAVQRVA